MREHRSVMEDQGPYVNPDLAPAQREWGSGRLIQNPLRCSDIRDPISDQALEDEVVFKRYGDGMARCYNKETARRIVEQEHPHDPFTREALPRYLYTLAGIEDPRAAEHRQIIENSELSREIQRIREVINESEYGQWLANAEASIRQMHEAYAEGRRQEDGDGEPLIDTNWRNPSDEQDGPLFEEFDQPPTPGNNTFEDDDNDYTESYDYYADGDLPTPGGDY